MWKCSCVDCESNIFAARAVFRVDGYHTFLLCVLAVILLTGDVIGVVLSRACGGC